jgi:hypothetical protein
MAGHGVTEGGCYRTFASSWLRGYAEVKRASGPSVSTVPSRARLGLVVLAAVASLAATCGGRSDEPISRERAISIARSQVTFEPDSVDAVRVTSAGVAVWRVTFRGRLPGQPPLLFETVIIEVDRRSGAVVSVART